LTRPALMAPVMLALLVTAAPGPAAAQVEAVNFENARQEDLYRDLIDELRCLVCANQSLSDSNADLAADLRARVYEIAPGGQSREAIIDYMVKRYGEYGLYRPRLSPATAFLWFAPFAVALAGFALIFTMAKRRSRQPPCTAAQSQQARALLEDERHW